AASGSALSTPASSRRGGHTATQIASTARRYSDPGASTSARDSTGIRRRKNTATAAATTERAKIYAYQSSWADVDVSSKSARRVCAASAVSLRSALAARHW